MRVGVHTVRPPPTPLSNPDVELLTSRGGSSAPGQGHTEREGRAPKRILVVASRNISTSIVQLQEIIVWRQNSS